MYSAPRPVTTPLNGMGNELIDGSGTINPAALNSGSLTSNIPAGAINRGVKRSRSPEAYGELAAAADDDDEKRRKRGKAQKPLRGYEATGDLSQRQQLQQQPLPPPAARQAMAESQMRTPQLNPDSLPQTSPAQTSPPPKATPTKPMVKALPTVRDHTTDQLNPEGDEYLPRERDDAGEKKVDAMGRLQGGRTYRCRTFTVPHRGEKLFMLATECARVLSYRDSYLLFNKNRSLYKIIASQEEKDDLIAHDILPYSYRSRQIAIVTARSMFRQFGSRVITNGRRVRDDYWEQKARKQGFTEDDLAGEKRPGAAKARESAAAEAAQAGAQVSSLPHADILYTNGPPLEGMPPHQPPIQPDDMRIRDFSNIPRPRQEISGPPYQDRTQPSTQAEIMNQASHTADFNKILNQQRNFRAKGLEELWNKSRDVPVSTPPPTASGGANDNATPAGPIYQSPNIIGSDGTAGSAGQQSGLISHHAQHQPMVQPGHSIYTGHQATTQYPSTTSPMRNMHQSQPPTPQQQQQQQQQQQPQPQQQHHTQPPQYHQRQSGSTFPISAAPQQSPYGYGTASHQHHSSHQQQQQQQQQMWGGPPPQPQPQPSPMHHSQNRMPTPTFSPHLSQQHPSQIHSPVPPSHSPHAQQQPQQQHQPPQLMHQGSASMQNIYGAAYPRGNMGMYSGQPNPSMGQQQYMQPGQGWPGVSQAGNNQQWGTY